MRHIKTKFNLKDHSIFETKLKFFFDNSFSGLESHVRRQSRVSLQCEPSLCGRRHYTRPVVQSGHVRSPHLYSGRPNGSFRTGKAQPNDECVRQPEGILRPFRPTGSTQDRPGLRQRRYGIPMSSWLPLGSDYEYIHNTYRNRWVRYESSINWPSFTSFITSASKKFNNQKWKKSNTKRTDRSLQRGTGG